MIPCQYSIRLMGRAKRRVSRLAPAGGRTPKPFFEFVELLDNNDILVSR